MTTPFLARLCGLVALLTLLPATAMSGIPQTEQRPVAETLHGVRMVDPYRWLEGNDQGEITEAVAAWTELQNAHTATCWISCRDARLWRNVCGS